MQNLQAAHWAWRSRPKHNAYPRCASPPAPGKKRTRPESEVNPGRIHLEPGAGRREGRGRGAWGSPPTAHAGTRKSAFPLRVHRAPPQCRLASAQRALAAGWSAPRSRGAWGRVATTPGCGGEKPPGFRDPPRVGGQPGADARSTRGGSLRSQSTGCVPRRRDWQPFGRAFHLRRQLSRLSSSVYRKIHSGRAIVVYWAV